MMLCFACASVVLAPRSGDDGTPKVLTPSWVSSRPATRVVLPHEHTDLIKWLCLPEKSCYFFAFTHLFCRTRPTYTIFGAQPLSRLYNDLCLLLVE